MARKRLFEQVDTDPLDWMSGVKLRNDATATAPKTLSRYSGPTGYTPPGGGGAGATRGSNVRSTLTSLIPYASNLVNAFRKVPRPMAPRYGTPVAFRPISMAAERNTIQQNRRAADTAADMNLDQNTAAAVRAGNMAQSAGALGQSYQRETNENSNIRNQQEYANMGVEFQNNLLYNRYQDELVGAQIAGQREQSENLANAADKFVADQTRGDQNALEEKKWQILSKAYAPGLTKRLSDTVGTTDDEALGIKHRMGGKACYAFGGETPANPSLLTIRPNASTFTSPLQTYAYRAFGDMDKGGYEAVGKGLNTEYATHYPGAQGTGNVSPGRSPMSGTMAPLTDDLKHRIVDEMTKYKTGFKGNPTAYFADLRSRAASDPTLNEMLPAASFALKQEYRFGGRFHHHGHRTDGGQTPPEMQPDYNIQYKKGGWIQKAVNPAHKGYCTPMTKSTCTPRRKAFAMTMKKHHGFHDTGGQLVSEAYDATFAEGGTLGTQPLVPQPRYQGARDSTAYRDFFNQLVTHNKDARMTYRNLNTKGIPPVSRENVLADEDILSAGNDFSQQEINMGQELRRPLVMPADVVKPRSISSMKPYFQRAEGGYIKVAPNPLILPEVLSPKYKIKALGGPIGRFTQGKIDGRIGGRKKSLI